MNSAYLAFEEVLDRYEGREKGQTEVHVEVPSNLAVEVMKMLSVEIGDEADISFSEGDLVVKVLTPAA